MTKYSHLHNDIILLRKAGKTLKEIMDVTGIPQITVSRILRKHGLPHYSDRHITDYSHLSRDWWACFTGFFMGEGYIGIALKGNYQSRKSFSPTLAIRLRDDDGEILNAIHAALGGKLWMTKAYRSSSPSIRWQVFRWDNVYSIVTQMTLDLLPGKKLQQVTLMLEACEARFNMPTRLSDENYEILYNYYKRMRLLKCYQSG